jgi:ankyrin repeat protein
MAVPLARVAKPADTIYDACRKGDVDRVVHYLTNKGSISEYDSRRMTLLHHAACGGNVLILTELLKRQDQGLNIEAADVDGWTALHYAANQNHEALVRALLDEGANINAKDELKRTPLHLAAVAGHAETAEVLLRAGANRNLLNVAGMMALQGATAGNHTNVVALFSK